MDYLLFAGYLLFFAWLVTRTRFFLQSGLSHPQLVILLLLKIMAGIFYGWIGIYYGQFAYMFDTWGFHYTSLEEYKLLLEDPGEFFSRVFISAYEQGYQGFFASEDSFWNDLKTNFFVSILSIFNIFSFGNYYINVIFFSYITLAGPIAFYRVLNDVFPGKKIQVLLATFVVPSFLYWTSGIHKDGLIFMAISIIVYHFYFGMKKNDWNWKRITMILLSFLLLLMLRNFLIIILVPALFAWYLSNRYQNRTALIFISTYVLAALLFFTLRYLNQSLDFPQAVVNKQFAFKQLQGSSTIRMENLEPDVISFIKNTPQAIASTVLRPHPGDVRHILSLAAASETNFLLLLFLCFMVWRTNGIRSKQFIWFCIFLSFSILLTIGYTVNFLGAIVRYRSIIIPFLVVPMVCLIDWSRLNTILFNNIKTKNNI